MAKVTEFCVGLDNNPGDSANSQVVVSDDTVIVDQDDSIRIVELDSESLIAEVVGSTDSVQPGRILAGQVGDDAFLRTVVDTAQQPDGTLLLMTEQASLDEVVQQGSTTVRKRVTFDGGGAIVNGKVMPLGKAADVRTSRFSIERISMQRSSS